VGHIRLRYYFAPGRGAKYCDAYVCLTVCLSVHSHNSKTTRPNFCARYTWPWLNPLLAALQLLYFWFCLESCTSHPTHGNIPIAAL